MIDRFANAMNNIVVQTRVIIVIILQCRVANFTALA